MIALKHVRFLIVALAFCLCTFMASCSSGGGGGGGDDGGGGETLSEYDFGLSLLADHPLTLSATLDSQPVTATLEKIFDGETFGGTYAVDDETITLSTGSVKVTTNIWDTPLSIGVAAPITSIEGDNPNQGSLQISNGEDFITVTITPPSGVNLSLNGGDPVPYSWDAFEELLSSDTAATWEKQASFASIIIGFIFNQLNFVIEAITLIEENDTALSKGSVTIPGDTFPGTPPDGHDAQGTLTLSSTDGNVGPGGDFSEVFHDYWVNDQLDDIDQLYDGSVNLVGFLERSDDTRDVITAIGFIPNGPDDPGGVFFDGDGLTIYETEESSGVFSIDDAATLTITGGYSIQFFEPTS